jgi:dTDP-4-amino-4,6-dideoxygalactose transaminase
MPTELRVTVGDFKITDIEKNAVIKVLENGRLSEGRCVQEFEKEFAAYIGTRYCVLVSSGTAAILAGLTALKYYSAMKINVPSKIITSPLSYAATANAITLAGFEPVFTDIDPVTFALLPDQVEELIYKSHPGEYSTILPVHLMGYPNDMESLSNLAQAYNLVLFEDSAQAHGSFYKGKKTGSLGLLADFSFYIAHNIQAGELGCITTDDEELYRLIRKIKANGRFCNCTICTRREGICPYATKDMTEKGVDYDPRFLHDLIGYNFKTMEFQAALGLCQLRIADKIFSTRQANVRYLNEHLKFTEKILRLPKFDPDVSYLAYPIVIADPARIFRGDLRRKLEEKGVETRPLFNCIPTQQPAYRHLANQYQGRLPNAEYLGQNGFYIGCHQYLDESDLHFVVQVFREIFTEENLL